MKKIALALLLVALTAICCKEVLVFIPYPDEPEMVFVEGGTCRAYIPSDARYPLIGFRLALE